MTAYVWKTLFDQNAAARDFPKEFRSRRHPWYCTVHGQIESGTLFEKAAEFDDYPTAQRWCDAEVQRMMSDLAVGGREVVMACQPWDGVDRGWDDDREVRRGWWRRLLRGRPA